MSGTEPRTNLDQAGRSLEHALGVLRRRAPWIVGCCLLAAVAAYGLSRHQPKRYTAAAVLVFNNNELSQQVAGLQAVSGGSQVPQQQTNLKMVQLGDMAEWTAKTLRDGLTTKRIKANVSVSAQGESNIVEVAATASSPSLAAAIANTYTARFVDEQQTSNRSYYRSALALVEHQLRALSPKQRLAAAGVALENRSQSLGVLAELRNGGVEVAQAATEPSEPSSPRVSRNTLLGALLGLLLGLAVAFLLERLDRRIREPEDLEAIYGLPLLGVVPESAALSRSAKAGNGGEALPPGEAEVFQLIRAHLRYFNVDRELHTLLVASAAPGDGKTTIARHLAVAAASMGSRVLLMEADLRRPTFAQQLSLRPGAGLSDVLIGARSLGDVTHSVDLGRASAPGAQARVLDVLLAGVVLPPNPGELIESHAMEALLEQAKPTYDLVVIDTPPLTAVSDAFPLLRKVDGVIIVGRVGRNRRDVAERLHETLTGAGAPVLGVIANGFKAGGLGGYAYAYNYATAVDGGEAGESPPVSWNGASPAEESLPSAPR
jgi:capsular exopolysaccharide synthesis family protein